MNPLYYSIADLKNGYTYDADKKQYQCLYCHAVFDEEEIFKINDHFYSAAKAIRLHLTQHHHSPFDALIEHQQEYLNLTDNHQEILKMIYQGYNDKAIAKKKELSTSTIRHQRFTLREKAKQAKVFLALYELSLTEPNQEPLAEIHMGAKMVDDRYVITQQEEDKILATYCESLEPLKLKTFSMQEKKKIVILKKITEQFKKDIIYSETQVNMILKPIYEDFVTIRRYLIQYGFMERTNDGKEYQVK